MSKKIKVGIIGAGLIGHKRAQALKNCDLVAVCDLNLERAKEFRRYNPEIVFSNVASEVINFPGVDLMVVATSNHALAPLVIQSLEKNIHVLVEKPAALNCGEFHQICEALKKSKASLKVGFNHRYHPGLQKAFDLFQKGEIGEIMFLRSRYGHGGRLGYEKEWRAKAELSGGGELIDQGVHLIDLAQWFLGPITKTHGSAHTYYWDMKVDDNAFLDLENASGKKAWLHVSCSEWKNTFSLEVYGKKGKIQVDGLGGSYGVEKCTFYKMLPEMGPPETTAWEYPFADNSWEREIQDFIGNLDDRGRWANYALSVLENLNIVNQIYKASGYAYHS